MKFDAIIKQGGPSLFYFFFSKYQTITKRIDITGAAEEENTLSYNFAMSDRYNVP